MINEAQVFLAGYVAREPKFRLTRNGVSMVSLRVGYTPRRVDRETGEWADAASSFVTVICWRGLADNVATCLRKGEPVLVKGRLQVRPYDKDGVTRLSVEIEASSVGHDLARGVARFQRLRPSTGETALGQPGAGVPGGPGGGAGGAPGGGMAGPEGLAPLLGGGLAGPGGGLIGPGGAGFGGGLPGEAALAEAQAGAAERADGPGGPAEGPAATGDLAAPDGGGPAGMIPDGPREEEGGGSAATPAGVAAPF